MTAAADAAADAASPARAAIDAARPGRGATAADRRITRAALARALVERAGPLAAALDWDTLDAAPAWLALAEPQAERLKAQVGALLAAPSIRLWIDAPRLAAAAQAAGPAYLRSLLALPDAQLLPRDLVNCPPIGVAEQVAPVLRALGAGVLLAALPSGALRKAAAAIWPAHASAMAQPLAHSLVTRAQALAAETDREER